jgi:hypothetical protein
MVDEGARNCDNCGAPLEFGYGATVITCGYCGSSLTLDGDVARLISKHTMLMNLISREQAIETAKVWMDKGIFRVKVAQESEIQNVDLKYLPVWTIPATLVGNYSGSSHGGYAADSRLMSDSFKKKDAKGFFKGFGKLAAKTAITAMAMTSDNRADDRVARNVNRSNSGFRSGTINEQHHQLILARRGTTMDLTKYPIPLGGKMIFDLNQITNSGGEILDGDMLEPEAMSMAESTAIEGCRTNLLHQVDNLQNFNVQAQLGEPELVHVPIWMVHYIHKGVERVAAVDGITSTVVNGDRPTVSLGLLGGKSNETPEQAAPPE